MAQIRSSDVPGANLTDARDAVRLAARAGADLVMIPEVTYCLSASRRHQMKVLRPEVDDPVLAGLRQAGAGPDGQIAKRSFLVASDGAIVARYDKIHILDVEL